VNGGCGFAIELLVQDGFQQRFEGRRRCTQAQGERTDTVNERGELGVRGAQVGESLVGIEGKFATAAVMDHGWSLSHGPPAVGQTRLAPFCGERYLAQSL